MEPCCQVCGVVISDVDEWVAPTHFHRKPNGSEYQITSGPYCGNCYTLIWTAGREVMAQSGAWDE